jgi:hypothetical protein
VKANVRYGAFDAAVRYELLSAEGVIGRFFSSIYLFDVVATSDLAVFGIGKVVQTPATAGDVLTLSVNISRSDTGQAVDLYTAVLGKPFTDVATCADAAFLLMASSVVDAAALVDSAQLSIGNVSADSATVSDGTTRSVGASKADSASTPDFSALLVDKLTSDEATATDLTVFNVDKQLQDFVFATDDTNGAAVDDDQNIIFFKILSNVSAVFDTISLLSTFDRAITDSSQVLDVAVVSATKTLSDGAAVGDTISIFIGIFITRDFFDTVLVTTDQAELSINKPTADLSTTTDSVAFVSAYSRILADTTAVADVASKTTTRPAADVVYLSDAFNVLLTAVRTNIGLVADSGQLLNQDYVDNPLYFADDYVGVKRIF